MSMNAEGGLWAGQEIKHGGKTQHANLESKMLNACSDDEEYDEYDEYVDVPVSGRRELCIAETREGRRYTDVCVDGRQDLPAGANAGTSTAREWVDSPQKARLYGDRPPLIAAAGAARQKAQVPIWEREERERQQFLGQVPAHLQACSAPPSLLPLADLLLQCQQVAPLHASPHARSTLRTLSLRVSGQ